MVLLFFYKCLQSRHFLWSGFAKGTPPVNGRLRSVITALFSTQKYFLKLTDITRIYLGYVSKFPESLALLHGVPGEPEKVPTLKIHNTKANSRI